MKSFLNLLALTIVLSSAACAPSSNGNKNSDPFEAKSFSVSACPYLEGRYKLDDMHMNIKESRFADSYRVVMGDSSREIIIDGKFHVSGKTSYQGFCADGVLEINGTDGNRRQKIRVYINSKNQMVQERTGASVETTVWDKE